MPSSASKTSRKSSADAPATESALPDTSAALSGADIVAELEQRFETLRTWHAKTREQFAQRQAELDERDDEIGKIRQQAEGVLADAEARRDEVRKGKDKLEHDRAAFEAYCKGEESAITKQKLACEEWVAAQHAAAESAVERKQARAEQEIARQRAAADAEIKAECDRLEAARQEIEALRDAVRKQRDELAQVRAGLDAEWDSVRMIRAAEDAALQAWQAEHDRVRQVQLRLVPAPDVEQTKAQTPRAKAA